MLLTTHRRRKTTPTLTHTATPATVTTPTLYTAMPTATQTMPLRAMLTHTKETTLIQQIATHMPPILRIMLTPTTTPTLTRKRVAPCIYTWLLLPPLPQLPPKRWASDSLLSYRQIPLFNLRFPFVNSEQLKSIKKLQKLSLQLLILSHYLQIRYKSLKIIAQSFFAHFYLILNQSLLPWIAISPCCFATKPHFLFAKLALNIMYSGLLSSSVVLPTNFLGNNKVLLIRKSFAFVKWHTSLT